MRQNPEKRPESAEVLISRLEGIEKAQIEDELLKKEKLVIERAERQAEEERLREEQEAFRKWERQAVEEERLKKEQEENERAKRLAEKEQEENERAKHETEEKWLRKEKQVLSLGLLTLLFYYWLVHIYF